MNSNNLAAEDINEIIEATLNIKNSLEILQDFCYYNETNTKLMSVSSMTEMLKNECWKILNKF